MSAKFSNPRGILVPTRAVHCDTRLKVREQLDDDAVERYAANYFKLPPLTVQANSWVLLDGWTRMAASSRALCEYCLIEEVDVADEQLEAAIEANATHGLAYSPSDRKRAVKLLLDQAEARGLTDAKIARLAGCTMQTVDNVRRAARRPATPTASTAAATGGAATVAPGGAGRRSRRDAVGVGGG